MATTRELPNTELTDDQLKTAAGGVGVPVSPLKTLTPRTLRNLPDDPLDAGGAVKMPPDDFGKSGA